MAQSRRPALKALMADVVHERLKGSGHVASWERIRKLTGMNGLEIVRVDELNTEVRVDTTDGSVWYTITIKEQAR
jgi:hypothetical protein